MNGIHYLFFSLSLFFLENETCRGLARKMRRLGAWQGKCDVSGLGKENETPRGLARKTRRVGAWQGKLAKTPDIYRIITTQY